jgi:hypothetical protein
MSQSSAEDLLQAIRTLPRSERLRLVERVVHELAEEAPAGEPASILGLFGADPDLIDEVVEDAMLARERDPLRRRDA